LIVHNVVATGLFARLYSMPSRLYDRFLSLYLAAIAIIAVVMIAAFPFIVGYIRFRSLGTDNIRAAAGLFPVVVLQIYAWGAWAALEMRLARTRRSAPAAQKTIILMAVIAGAASRPPDPGAAKLALLHDPGRAADARWGRHPALDAVAAGRKDASHDCCNQLRRSFD
jgi:hypothetical protein